MRVKRVFLHSPWGQTITENSNKLIATLHKAVPYCTENNGFPDPRVHVICLSWSRRSRCPGRAGLDCCGGQRGALVRGCCSVHADSCGRTSTSSRAPCVAQAGLGMEGRWSCGMMGGMWSSEGSDPLTLLALQVHHPYTFGVINMLRSIWIGVSILPKSTWEVFSLVGSLQFSITLLFTLYQCGLIHVALPHRHWLTGNTARQNHIQYVLPYF